MQYSSPHHFQLLLTGPPEKRVFSPKGVINKITDISTSVTEKAQPKIYILKVAGEIVYVGYASQSIWTRLRQGMRANGLNGYHGYKWKHQEEVELTVFVFAKKFSENEEKKKAYKTFVEAIEAELVYMIRQETGQWPIWQNEIHFNNDRREEVLESARDMYNQVNLS